MAFFSEDRQSRLRSTFQIVNDINEQIAYLRSSVIGLLVRECTRVFLEHEQEILAGTFEGALIKHIAEGPAAAYNHCAEISLKRIYRSQDVLDIEPGRLPHHQHFAGIDGRCRHPTGKRKGLLRAFNQPRFRPIQYKIAHTLRKNTGGT